MVKQITGILVCLMLSFASVQHAHSTGFPQGKDRTMIINGLFYYHANAFWDINRNLSYYDEEGLYESLSYRVYIEHGLSTNLTAILSFPYTGAAFENLTFAESRRSAGDVEAGLAWRFWYPAEDFMLSARALLIWPAYDSSPSPVPGYGYTGLDFQLIAAGGVLIGQRGAFYSISGGFRTYFETDIFQWLYSVNAGTNLLRNLELLLELSGRWSESSDVSFTPQDVFINTNFDVHKAGIGLLWMIKPESVGLLGQLYRDYSGSRVAKGKAGSVSILLFF